MKPDIPNYKKVLLARTIDAANRRKAEIGLKPSERIPRAELDKLPAKDKMTVGPLESTPLEGINVGVTDPFSSEFKIGYSFKARKKETGNARKDGVNKILEKHGYNRTDNLYGAETDGDHVGEKQLGGKDHENNVWPLKSATNQDSGRKVLQERKRIVEQYGLSSLDGIWLRLSTSPAGPGKPGS